MVATLLYVLPMLLGRTFDIKTSSVGVDIFRQDSVDKPTIIDENGLRSRYRRVRDFSDVQDLLQVSGEISLKVKAGMVNIGGSGSYLKENEYRGDVEEILTVMTFVTVSKLLPKTASLIPGWENLPRRDLGTHYVSRITYGGKLIASLKFRAVNEKFIEQIKATINGALQVDSAFDLVAVGKLDKLQKDLQGKASLEITYFATVPLKGVAHTVEGLRDLVNGFQDHVKDVNGGIGVPIRVELTELSTLSTQFPFRKHPGLENRLKLVEIQFNDLLQVESGIKGWLKKYGSFLTEEQEKEIDDFYTTVLDAIIIFKEDINNLDIEEGPDQLNRIVNIYKMGGGTSIPGKYKRKWEQMQRKLIVPEPKKDKLLGNSVYIRWGRTECNEKTAENLSKGYMAVATAKGSPSSAMCLPEEPQFVDSKIKSKSSVASVRYGMVHLNPFAGSPNLFDTSVRCSVCYVQGRNTVIDLPMNECPDEWEMEYRGYYLSGRKNAPKSEAFCVDGSPEKFNVESSDKGIEQYILALTHRNQVVPCVVCSK